MINFKNRGEKAEKGKIDLRDLISDLVNPYRYGIRFCLLGVFFCLGYSFYNLNGSYSFLVLISAFILLYLIYWMRKKLKEIDDKIYLWGVEETWKYYKKKNK